MVARITQNGLDKNQINKNLLNGTLMNFDSIFLSLKVGLIYIVIYSIHSFHLDFI